MISTSMAFLSRPAPAAASAIFCESVDGPGIRAAARGGFVARTGFLKTFVVAFFVTEIKPRPPRTLHYSPTRPDRRQAEVQFTSPRAGIQGKVGFGGCWGGRVCALARIGRAWLSAGVVARRRPRRDDGWLVFRRRRPRWQTSARASGKSSAHEGE